MDQVFALAASLGILIRLKPDHKGLSGRMIKQIQTLAFSLIFLSIAGCVSSDRSTGSPSPERASDYTYANAINIYAPIGEVRGMPQNGSPNNQILDSRLEKASEYASDMESYSFLVWSKCKLIHSEYFEPHNRNTRPESASMHKSILALVVGAAIDDGYISSVEDTVSDYLSEWESDNRADIRIRHLLQMTSGLAPLQREGGNESPAYKFGMEGEKARETILALPLAEEPGDTFHYANTISQILGLVVERATRQEYATYLSERIWSPAECNTAYVWFNEPNGFPRTYAALMATSEDWLKMGLLVKDAGRIDDQQIVSSDFIDSMIQPSDRNPNYGFHIWIGSPHVATRYYNEAKTGFSARSEAPFALEDIIYFDGFGGQRVYISRAADLVIVRQGNIRLDWDESKLVNLVVEGLETTQ